MKTLNLRFILALALTGAAASSFAAILTQPIASPGGPLSGTIQVTATVTEACTISVNDLAFGAYNPSSTTNKDVTNNNAITYTCTKNSTPQLEIDTSTLGMTATGAPAPANETLSYFLYPSATAGGTQWENGAPYILTPATGVSQTASYSGRITAGQFVPPISYTQDVTMSLSF